MYLIIVTLILTEIIGFLIWENNFLNQKVGVSSPTVKEYNELEKLLEEERRGGYVYGGGNVAGLPTLSDRISNELQVTNNNRLTELITAIDKFNNTSTILSKLMVFLSIILIDLAILQIYLTFKDKRKHASPDPIRFTY